ncbi:MAG: hypothetical protein M1836_007494 [Candelina mexicana]|nr:MAG: hypothetical protein M1836_007494 [Candelina mexicana]
MPSYKLDERPISSNGDTSKSESVNASNALQKTVLNGRTTNHYSQITIVKEITSTVTAKCEREFGCSVDELFANTPTVETFLDYVAAERLRRMPHKGSKWDKVLQWAEYFAGQVHLFEEAVTEFVPYSRKAAQLVWSNCRLLLEMGPKQINVLEKVFGVFYNMGLTLSAFLNNSKLFMVDGGLQHTLAHAYAEFLSLAVNVSTYYTRKDLSSTLDPGNFDSLFGETIDSFYGYRDIISDAMWTCKLHHNVAAKDITVDVRQIRQFLAPQDRTVRILASDRMMSRDIRHDFTCAWFEQHLMDFTRSQDDLFFVAGKAGSGKSVLTGWIVDRLRRAHGKKAYEVISYAIDADLKTETTSFAVVKGLLLQLIDLRVGDIALYKSLAEVLTTSTSAKTLVELENAVWTALEAGLEKSGNLMSVIDGLDQLNGGEEASHALLKKIHKITGKPNAVKSLILSRPLSKAGEKHAKSFVIEPSHVKEDIQRVMQHALSSFAQFRNLAHHDKAEITEKLSTSANGCFVWANQTLEIVKKEKTFSGIMQRLESAPVSLMDVFRKLIATLDLQQHDTQSILAWLLAAERPLSLAEIKLLLEIDISHCTHGSRFTDIEEDVRHAVGPFVDIRDGIVRLRHVTIRQFLLDQSNSVRGPSNSGNFPFALEEAHYDLTTRCIAYMKIFIIRRIQPAFEVFSAKEIDELFSSNLLLEYSVRYWTSHSKSSPMYGAKGGHKLVSEFKGCFPDRTLLSRLEGSCWTSQTSVQEAAYMHSLSLSLRKLVFGERHRVVLQTTISLARCLERSSSYEEASELYYKAHKLCQTILERHSQVTIACATAYIACTVSLIATKRDEIINRREELLKYIISSYKETHGASYELTITYTRVLAKMYVEIHETSHAAILYRELYEMCVERYGHFATETIEVYQTLILVLERESKTAEIEKILRLTYEATLRSLTVWDSRRIGATIRIIEYYEARHDVIQAEQILVNLWRLLSYTTHTHKEIVVQERKIEITLFYAKFLKRCLRTHEAENILRGLWTDYEHEDIHEESLIIQINSIAETMKEFSILTVAKSVFKSVWSFYKKIGKQTITMATSAVLAIVEISEETKTTTEFEESILMEVYQSTVTKSTSTTIDIRTIKTCETLSTFYFKRERWSKAIEICSVFLHRLWPTLLADEEFRDPPSEYTAEVIEIATRLAYCYHKELNIQRSEEIYRFIYEATKASLPVEDEVIITTAKNIISFYESVQMYDKAIGVYLEIYKGLRGAFGTSHSQTIEIGSLLGNLFIRQDRFEESEHYYREIFEGIRKGSDVIPQNAIEIALTLCRIYKRSKRWEAARTIYNIMWQTFIKRGKEYNLSTTYIDELYHNYVHILQHEIKVEYTVIRQLTVQFRETCIKLYGTQNELTIKSTLRLAEISEWSEEHREESISMYEEFFKETKQTTTTTTTTRSMITEARLRLASLYSSKSSTTTKAVAIYTEEFESTKAEYGCSHKTTLTRLSELLTCYKKQNTKESTTRIVQTLQSTIVEVITTETHSERLFESAGHLASLYLSMGHTETAYELLREIRRQIISGDTKASSKFGFTMNGLGRSSYVFIVAFEERLKGTTRTTLFTDIMAEIMIESILYESYTRTIKSQSTFEMKISFGAQLWSFLKSKHREEEYRRIETELYEIFRATMKVSKETKMLRELFEICIREMGKDQHKVTIIESAVYAVLSHLEKKDFQGGYELACFIDKYMHLHHGFYYQQNIEAGFKLCLYLTGRGGVPKTDDKSLRHNMKELAKAILRQVFEAAQHLNIKFIHMPVKQLNDLVGLLGEFEDYDNLEWLLEDLWSSRQTQKTWKTETILSLGKSLVNVRFSRGHQGHESHHAKAIHLCEDICYNLRRVYGDLDRSALEMSCLKSELYTAQQQYGKAMAVHEDILRQSLSDDNDLTGENLAGIAKTHLELLKRCFQRNKGWAKEAKIYEELGRQLVKEFSKYDSWKGVQSVEKWDKKAGPADELGMWKRPTTFELEKGEGKDENTRPPVGLRRTSGMLLELNRNTNAN